MQFLLARDLPPAGSIAAVIDFGRWVASWAPSGSPLLLLPAYAQIEQCRLQTAQGGVHPLWRREWAHEHTLAYTLAAFHNWFKTADPALRSVLDLSYLAYALWAGHQYVEAAEVFMAMDPYAAPEPWTSVPQRPPGPSGGEELMLRARRESLAYARSHTPAPDPADKPASASLTFPFLA
ncbi:hypothetical protein ACFW1M_11400 [Streptomyces inhibens]|uniref:hypothetical protein n=1 Tax=Streptomyces inhibens TaxID=2293571 RepID=UPI0036B4ABD5